LLDLGVLTSKMKSKMTGLTLKRMGDLDTSLASVAVAKKQTKKLSAEEAPVIKGKMSELISTEID
jgi:hypothetical protein